jgi:hypothetical protein
MSYTNGLDKPTDYFETVTYTASTSSSYSETSLQFQPDFIWLKNRDTTYPHHLFDAVRGSSLGLSSNSADEEQTRGSTYLTSFDSNGFTTGTSIASDSADGVVAWSWLASNTTASNTSGSITSTVSASTTSGFSIVSYTGTLANATVGHGLGVAPKVIFIKCRGTNARSWVVYHDSIGNTKHLTLNETDAEATSSASFNNTSPTSSVFSLGNSNNANDSTTMIAYCFAEKKGYSKFGQYTGNGSADGTFVYTGFKPAMVIVKQSNTSRNWLIMDNKRNEFNDVDKFIKVNTSDAEGTTTLVDFTSNGFKCRTTDTGVNESGGTYIYMAFAENPFVTSTGIPTTAR